ELVALKPAVTGKAPLKIVMRQQDGDKDPLVHVAGDTIPPELVAIIGKATSKAKNERYKDVASLAEDIRRYLRGEAVLARPDTPRQAILRWISRHRELTLIAMLMFMMAAGVAITGTIAYSAYEQYVQHQHETRLSRLLTDVSVQSARI